MLLVFVRKPGCVTVCVFSLTAQRTANVLLPYSVIQTTCFNIALKLSLASLVDSALALTARL
jgi:hypothetical protein